MKNQDNKGKFVPGNKASPGRPRRATEQEYMNVIYTHLTPEKWDGIVFRAILQAEDGDRAAREWLASFVIGKPPEMIDLPLSDMQDFAFVANALKKRGGDVSDALQRLVEMVNVEIANQSEKP